MEIKALKQFDPEHVFSRGLCGTGQNWTLTEEVCRKCNSRFSASEAHWMRQAFEAMVRNFHGPESRSEKDRFDRVQPMELEHLYIVNRGDPNVYEAGFSFPAEYHLRPQIVETADGLLPVAGTVEDGDRLQQALDILLANPIRVVIPAPGRSDERNHVVADIEPRGNRRTYTITSLALNKNLQAPG